MTTGCSNTGLLGDIKNSVTFSGLAVGGDFTVTEDGETGYSLADLTCTGLTAGDSGDNTTAGVVTIDNLAAGQSVTCTYTNELLGSITIIKDVNPEPDVTDFSFSTTGTGLTDFSLDDDGVNTGLLGDIKNSVTFSGLAVGGDFTVTEDGETGYSLADLTCTGLTAGDSGDNTTAGVVTIDNLAAGQSVTCTYTNELLGSITIIKDVNPEPDVTDFSFSTTGTGLTDFSLDDDGVNTGLLGDIKNSVTFSGLAVGGDFTVTEDGETGYSLADLTCTGLTAGDSGDNTTAGVVTIDNLAAGQSVTCTYTNELAAYVQGCAPGFSAGWRRCLVVGHFHDPDWTSRVAPGSTRS